MSTRKLTYEIAGDIRDGKITLDDAMATWGHIIDRDDLEDVLASLGSVTDNEDGTVTIRVPDSWERTWSEDPA